jgi:hypothetical protein
MGALLATSVSVSPFNPSYPAEFVTGYHRALEVGAAILIVGALVAVSTIRNVAREPRQAAEAVIEA